MQGFSRCRMRRYFYPRPPRGGRRERVFCAVVRHSISIHALREEGDQPNTCCMVYPFGFLSTPSARRATGRGILYMPASSLFLSTPSARRATVVQALRLLQFFRFLSTPSARRATAQLRAGYIFHGISIHALREEGDSKNGEKHLRFCFIIKRSAQIWKSLSKNIRKKSCDLHRTA